MMSLCKPLRRIVIAALVSCGIAGIASAKDYKTLTIGTEGAYEPWNFVTPDGKLAGFEVELANALCDKMKVTCTIVQQDWDGMIPALNAGKFDAIMAGMNITPARLKVIDFSTAYASGPAGFLVAKDGPLAKLPGIGTVFNLTKDEAGAKPTIDAMREMLKGKTIGVQVATIHANFVDKYFKDVATIQEYKTTEQHDLDLMAGRIDAAFADVPYFTTTLSKPEAKDLMLAGAEFRGGDIFGRGVGVGLRKTDPELKAMFDTAIAASLADGTIKTIAATWFKTIDMAPPA